MNAEQSWRELAIALDASTSLICCRCYTAALNFGASFGIVISSCIIINLHWRWIYYISACIIGALTILIFFTMPETSFNRNSALLRDCSGENSVPGKQTYTQRLRLYNGKMTDESYWTMFIRPPILLILPPVLWATLCMAATIGFVYGLSTNFATAYGEAYGFTAWQSGLCYISGLIGPAIGLYFGGPVSDWVAQIFTRRHSGIREPEYRLPAITIGLIASPLSLVLYGVGIQHRLHWMVPTIGLGLRTYHFTLDRSVLLTRSYSQLCCCTSNKCITCVYRRCLSTYCR